MGRELQKKKNRSSIPKTRNKKKGLLANGKKKINIYGNKIIADNWDRKETLSQNYKRLGLTSRLNAPTGGIEKFSSTSSNKPARHDPLHIPLSATNTHSAAKIKPAEVRVERDPETGKILRVIRDEDNEEGEEELVVAGKIRDRKNPLNDPLNEVADEYNEAAQRASDQKLDGEEFNGFDDDDDEEMEDDSASSGPKAIVKALEAQVEAEAAELEKRKPRTQSKREEEWIERLVEKYGDDTRAMVRDRRLNPMQQSEGDIKRRIRKWKASREA